MATLDVFTNRGIDPDGFLFRVVEDGGYSSWASSRIVLTENVHGDSVSVAGSGFVWNSLGQVVGGTVTGWTLVADNGSMARVAGLVTDANSFFAAVEDVWNRDSFAALDDILYGTVTWDSYGGAGADYLTGGDFNDTLTGAAGNDTLFGGRGFDLVDYGAETGRFTVAVDLETGRATDTFGNSDRLFSVENIVGTNGGDDLRGNNARNAISGGSGGDLIYGRAGVDGLYGGAGQDTIYGGTDNDLVQGDAHSDWLSGDGGNDRVYGGSGNDIIYGGSGNDALRGDAGNDRVNGGAGNDQLWGGAGDDRLIGGTGTDLFRFASNFGADTISDFNWSERDRVDLRQVAGVHRFSDIGQFENARGDAVAVIGHDQITFTNVSWNDLRASDFLIV